MQTLKCYAEESACEEVLSGRSISDKGSGWQGLMSEGTSRKTCSVKS